MKLKTSVKQQRSLLYYTKMAKVYIIKEWWLSIHEICWKKKKLEKVLLFLKLLISQKRHDMYSTYNEDHVTMC